MKNQWTDYKNPSGWVEYQNNIHEETIDNLGLKSEIFIQNDTLMEPKDGKYGKEIMGHGGCQ